MNKLSEKELIKLHEVAIVEMYGPQTSFTHGNPGHGEWHHSLNVVIDVLEELEKMGYINLDEFSFGEKNADKIRYRKD